MAAFNRLGLHLGDLSRPSNAKTRSISPKNLTGEPGRPLPDRDFLEVI